jgi:SHS2 domain-containing protein
MGYELHDHTADVGVSGEGPTLGAAMAAVADGMAAAMADERPDVGERFAVEVTAESREALLFDYLDQLIYERDVRGVLPVDNQATVEEGEQFRLEGSARGIPLDRIRAREIKAVTYSEMDLRRTDDGWRAYVVLDV